MSEEEAFEHAIEMIQTRQMGFRKAADFFSVSLFLEFVWVRVGSSGSKIGSGLALGVQKWVNLDRVYMVVWKNKVVTAAFF